MSRHCNGCRKSFSYHGFIHHIQQTRNTECLAFGDSIGPAIPEPTFSDDETGNGSHESPDDGYAVDTIMANVDMDAEPIPFEGDYFGVDYTMYEMGQGDLEKTNEDGFGVYDSDEDDDFDEDGANAVYEQAWEPARPSPVHTDVSPPTSLERPSPPPPSVPQSNRRVNITDRLRHEPFVEKFGGDAGKPIPEQQLADAESRYGSLLGNTEFPWYPFASQLDWMIARWAKLRGPSPSAFNELLQIPGLVESLGLSFKTSQELNKLVDNCLPGRPQFRRKEVVVADESFEFYYRDILECIRALWGDTDFAPYLIFCPERHYTDESRDIRLFHSMHTGKWWWSTQKEVEKTHPGATIIPVIISTDKTQLTVFGNKTAYPVYITIGNIPKEIRRKPSRRAYILLGYLPTSNLNHISNKSARRRTLANLFHACMRFITSPLHTAGINGMVVVDGKGIARRGHPIFAVYVADYPEQGLASNAKYGRCPALCTSDKECLGDDNTDYPFLDLGEALRVLETLSEGPATFHRACKEAGMKPIPEPFWKGLPYANIYQSITPDILHQLYQGMVKHLVEWLVKVIGAAEIDARCRRFPPNHNIRLFMRGISTLTRVTGKEHEQMCHLLLGLIIGARLPNGTSSNRLCAAVRGMLDFVYLAQYPLHTSETLSLLRQSLTTFHDNKDIFVELGVVAHFKIPKLHACQHFARHFANFGTSDNYNTEYTERLHIELAKDAYRATNHRDELPQMVTWLERQEKIRRHEKYIHSLVSKDSPPPLLYDITPGVVFERTLKMTRHPTKKSVPFPTLLEDYGATSFHYALSHYVARVRNPMSTQRQIEQEVAKVFIPFSRVPVWQRIKWTTPDIYSSTSTHAMIVDSAHIQPARKNTRGHIVPGRFDTVLVNVAGGGPLGVKGYRVARVRVVFSLPPKARDDLFNSEQQSRVPHHLAYVEWFTTFTTSHAGIHGLYKVSPSMERNGFRKTAIIPVRDIRRSVHLYPAFGAAVPQHWTSSNVLDEADHFYVNPFSDRHAYLTIF